MKNRLSGFQTLVVTSVGCLFLVVGAPTFAAGKPGLQATDESGAETARRQAVDSVFAQFNQPGSPGMAVGVYKGSQIVYANGYGLADLEHNIPITPKSVFHVASISKQFTAFAIALLARDGKVDLDGDIRRYLPDVPDFGKPITVRDLIRHTGGLRDDLPTLAGRDSGDVLVQQHVLNIVARQRGLNFAPGAEALYCNTGYELLAEIVHAVSGQTLRDYLADHVFQPLGMARTFVHDDVNEIILNRVEPYEKAANGKWRHSLLNYGIYGSTNLHTTIEDMAKWAGNFGHPVVGDAALIQQITAPSALADGSLVNYGFGLWRTSFAGHKAVMHTGSDAGYHLIFAHFPDTDFTIAIFSNIDVNRFNLLEAVADIYLNGGAGKASKTPPAITPEPRLLQAAVGHYIDPLGHMITLDMAGDMAVGALTRTPAGGEAKPVIFRVDGSIDTGGERFWSYERLRTDNNGRVTAIEQIIEFLGRKPVIFTRIEPARPSQEAMAALAGDYRNSELDVTYRFSVEGGRLVARTIWTVDPIVFTPTVVDGFESSLGAIKVERDAKGKPVGLKINTENAHHVSLRKVPAGW